MTFEPTHITTNAIGDIPARTPIRVAIHSHVDTRLGDIEAFENFGDILAYLGDRPYISYKSEYGDIVFTGERVDFRGGTVIPGDFVITDGDRFAVSSTDSGWEPISGDNPETMVNLRFRMSNGDEYTTQPETLERIENSGIMDIVSNLNDSRYIEIPLTYSSKVVLNPKLISSVEVIHNV